MNIKFKNIEINNFLSLGEGITVQLESRGYVVIKGINNESAKTQSNGAGKSSIFDAIFWTITGDTLRGTSEVVNEFNKAKGCLCKLELEVDDITYVIERTKGHPIKNNSCSVYENGILLADQTKKSQEVINNTIGIAVASDVLGSIILLGQGLPYRFSNLSPIKRKDLLEIMSGSSSKIDELKFKLDTKNSNLLTEIHKHEEVISKCEGENNGLNISITSIESEMNEKESPQEINSKIRELTEKCESFDEILQTRRDEIANFNSELESLEQVKNNVNNYIIQQEALRNNIQNNLNSIKSGVCPTCGRPYEVSDEALADKSKFEKDLIDADLLINNLKAKLTGVNSQIIAKNQEITNSQGFLNSTLLEKSNNEKEIERLRSLLKDNNNWTAKLKEFKNTITNNSITINDTKSKIEALNNICFNIDYLKRILSREFKGYMLDEVINYISDRSTYYGKYVFNDDKLVTVSLSGNKILIQLGERLYENLSGGERQRVDLCVQFALRDMLTVVTGFSCNIIVLDEVFDNLDSKGTDDLINMITSEFSDVDSIFIITHHTDISIPYDDVILITKDANGVSEISG